MTRRLKPAWEALLRDLLPENVTMKTVHRLLRIRADTYVHLPFMSGDRGNHRPDSHETSAGLSIGAVKQS